MILQAADMTLHFFCSPIILDCFSFIITAVYFTWQAQIASTTANFMNDVLKNDRWLPKILTTFACDKCRSGNKWFLYAKLFGRNNPFAEWTQLFLKITYIVYTLGQTDKIWIHNEKFAQKNKIILGGRWRCHSKYNFFVISLICSLQYC